MGNCAKSIQDNGIHCKQLPFNNMTKRLHESGQLSHFKKELLCSDSKNNPKWDSLFQQKVQPSQNTLKITEIQRKALKQLQNNELKPQISHQANVQQNQLLSSKSNMATLSNKINGKSSNYESNQQNLQNCSQNAFGTQDQQLPRPQGKIMKKRNYCGKVDEKTASFGQNHQSVERQTNNLQIPTKLTQIQEPSIVDYLQSQDYLSGKYVQGKYSSRVKLKFVLPKARAGPLIVSEIDYNYYAV